MGTMVSSKNPWGMSLHIPILIFLQLLFIVLFGLFTRCQLLEKLLNFHWTPAKTHKKILSQQLWIIAPIPTNKIENRKNKTNKQKYCMAPVTCHMSPVTPVPVIGQHMSPEQLVM